MVDACKHVDGGNLIGGSRFYMGAYMYIACESDGSNPIKVDANTEHGSAVPAELGKRTRNRQEGFNA